MKNILAWLVSERGRGWLYRVLTAAIPLLVVYGVLEESKAAVWIGLGAAVLGTGVAAANTSTKAP